MSSMWQIKPFTGKAEAIIRLWETKACQKGKWRIISWKSTNEQRPISLIFQLAKCMKNVSKTQTDLCVKRLSLKPTVTKLDVKSYPQTTI